MSRATDKAVDKKFITEPLELADYIGYYLSETVQDLSEWDCEHLAINMLNELKIVKPNWWDGRLGNMVKDN